MKINYLRNPIEDEHISMVQYIDDLMDYQKKYSNDLIISDYTPKFSRLLKYFSIQMENENGKIHKLPTTNKKTSNV